jgi:hypothetical protein
MDTYYCFYADSVHVCHRTHYWMKQKKGKTKGTAQFLQITASKEVGISGMQEL